MENCRILLLDSDTGFLKSLAGFLASYGYQSTEIRSDCTASAVEDIPRFDCAVVELCDLITGGVTDRLPVALSSVIFTCRCHTIETERCARLLRPSVYLVKPIAPVDILAVIFRVTEMKERSRLAFEYGFPGKMTEIE